MTARGGVAALVQLSCPEISVALKVGPKTGTKGSRHGDSYSRRAARVKGVDFLLECIVRNDTPALLFYVTHIRHTSGHSRRADNAEVVVALV